MSEPRDYAVSIAFHRVLSPATEERLLVGMGSGTVLRRTAQVGGMTVVSTPVTALNLSHAAGWVSPLLRLAEHLASTSADAVSLDPIDD
jgi:uncharacterized membrane protein